MEHEPTPAMVATRQDVPVARPSPGPGRGSLRVQAWIYTALNPVISGCRREHELLAAGNPSWRPPGGELAWIHPVEEWLSWGGRQNLADLARFAPALEPLIHTHDSTREALLHMAKEAYDLLIADRRFCAVVHAVRHHARGMAETELVARIATRVINSGPATPPSRATTSGSWLARISSASPT